MFVRVRRPQPAEQCQIVGNVRTKIVKKILKFTRFGNKNCVFPRSLFARRCHRLNFAILIVCNLVFCFIFHFIFIGRPSSTFSTGFLCVCGMFYRLLFLFLFSFASVRAHLSVIPVCVRTTDEHLIRRTDCAHHTLRGRRYNFICQSWCVHTSVSK